MNLSVILKLVFCFLFPILLGAQQDVIGFLPSYRFSQIPNIDFEKVSHVNLAFLNPNLEGELFFDNNVPVEQALENMPLDEIKVFISLAGGYLKPEWDLAWQHWLKDENRSEFIHFIMKYCKDYHIDGIDVDLEWQYVTMSYSPFVIELKDSCDKNDLILTASLPGTYRYPEITDEALATFEWVNMMVYDLTGPWDPSNAGPHSPFSFAESSFSYWKNQGMTADKLTLGVPFYGYNFTNADFTTSFSYRSMVEIDSDYAFLDQVGSSYYNGIYTIQDKTMYSYENGMKGIMIWELGQDHFGQYSLLNAIHEAFELVEINEEVGVKWKVYPNPAGDYIFSQNSVSSKIYLIDYQGNTHFLDHVIPGTNFIDLSSFPSGIYFIRLESSSYNDVKTIVKK